MKKMKRAVAAAGVLAGVLTAGLSLAGCSRGKPVGQGSDPGSGNDTAGLKVEAVAQAEYPQEPVYRTDDERWEARQSKVIPERFQEAYGSFAYRTASGVLGDGTEVNAVYSPLGLYYTLAVAAQGAGGETRQELLDLLGYTDEGIEGLAEDCRTTFQALYHVPNPANSKKDEWGELPADALYNLRIANSLWADEALEVKQEFADQAAQYFYSDVFRTDLHAPGVTDAMTGWVRERTNGVIAPAAREIPEEELLSLRNTIYYYDEWIDRFNEDKTKEDVFTTADGARVTCLFMNREMDSHGFRRGENYTASSLSLKNGSMLFVLPDEGVDVRELVKSPEILKEVLEGTSGRSVGEVIWKLPKFSYGSSRMLSGVLEDLGVRKAFGTDADFSGISDWKPLGIFEASQDAHIGIDENGVEAAAFTELAYAGAAPPSGRAEMLLDRPFLYAIQSRGQILFVGICGNPELHEQAEAGQPENGQETGQSGDGQETGQPGDGQETGQSGDGQKTGQPGNG